MITGNESAHPIPATEQHYFNQAPMRPEPGLTIRQHFAAMAMQGILSDSSNSDISSKWIKEKLGLSEDTIYEYPKHYMQYISISAVAAADALIAELNKQQ